MKISTHWLKDFVTLAPPLERIAERLTLAGLEVKKIEPRPDLKDTVFEVEVTTNRPDWLSHLGVAREIHAIENTGLKTPPSQNPGEREMPSGWKINLKEQGGCPYYTACLLEGVEQKETPDWMQNRLSAAGLHSINLIVDITNYVLLEVGQPLHAFDADLLQGKEIEIRRAKPEETLVAIDGTRYGLSNNDLVIADREKAVAIAGVMGGQGSEVNPRTRNILLESAFFDPRWVRKTSLRLALASESSYRFERRIDPEGVDLGRERAILLFRELAGVRRVSAVLKAGRKPTLPQPKIHLSLDQIEKLLGTKIKPHQIHSVLTRLGLEPKSENPQSWTVTVPSYRADLERPVDLIEEVARLIGYDQIPEVLPERAPLGIKRHPLRALEETTRNWLAGAGLFETVTSSLVNPAHFRAVNSLFPQALMIHNPIHEELTLLRPSLVTSLLEVYARNERVGEKSVPLFEIANLYSRSGKGEGTCEEKTLGVLLGGQRPAGWRDPKRPYSYYDLKGMMESYLEGLGVSGAQFKESSSLLFETGADLWIGKEKIGSLGETADSLRQKFDLRNPVYFCEISIEKLRLRLPPVKKLQAIARYPAIERDLSVVVDESVRLAELVQEIERLGRGLVLRVELFDLFRGGRIPAGKKNLAVRLVYQSLERTLVSEEIQPLHEEIAREVAKKFQAAFQDSKGK